MARNANSRTTPTARPKPLASRPMPRLSASVCGRAWSTRTSAASESCWSWSPVKNAVFSIRGPRRTGQICLVRGQEQAEQERKEPGQPGAEQAEVVSRRGEDEVGGVALRAEQEVAAEVAIGLHVADDGLDGVAAAPLAADGGRDAALLAGEDDAGLVGIVATVAAIHVGALDPDAGEALGLGDLGGEGVPVVGVARQGPGAEDELAAWGLGVGGGDRELHAKLVAGVCLALADALHLGGPPHHG